MKQNQSVPPKIGTLCFVLSAQKPKITGITRY